jgi:hypothetical protein
MAKEKDRIPYDEHYREPGTWSKKQMELFGVDYDLYQQAIEYAGEAMNADGDRRIRKLSEAIYHIIQSDPNADGFGVPRWYIMAAYTQFDAFDPEEIEAALTRLVGQGKVEAVPYTRYSTPTEESIEQEP